jgi:trans-2,3-dihydro-3-hydroxyanthranilate isomerase
VENDLRDYAILDVFTDRPFCGNPLAVVTDSEGLEDAQMQAIAREFNLSQTVFVASPNNRLHRGNVRIFTPLQELPFAGHPTIGTAVLLALDDARENPSLHEAVLLLEEKIGPIRCGVFLKNERTGRAIFDVPSEPVELASKLDREAVANALDLLPGEVCFENHVPSVYSAGVPFAFVPVRNLEVIARAEPNMSAWADAFSSEAASVFVYCRETQTNGRHFHARMFAPSMGIDEDPATGSAVAALSGAIMRFDALSPGDHHFVVEQGLEMGRPSLIDLEIEVSGGRIDGVRIGGDAVVIARGALDIG